MKKVFIKYNPYNLTTELTVDGQQLAENSRLRELVLPGSRMQDWIEELPKCLAYEYNDTEFNVKFHGTLPDFEDLTEVFAQSLYSGELKPKLERIPVEDAIEKEAQLVKLFKDIQKGPFNELKDETIKETFKQAMSNDFDVCIVATMSAGKSTLINAMLGTKLMPSMAEACTAIITKIKDIDGKKNWEAEVYNREGRLIETHENLTYSDMKRLNDDENVSEIKITGDILFVPSDEMSLVLIDTPGPNNARNRDHLRVQSEFLDKSSKTLVLYVMEGTFGSDSDNELLHRVAESMKVGGKQSKDRFVFIVNKMDDRRKEDGDTEYTLKSVRDYLKTHGIENPNLFPVAALPALNIRLMQNGTDIDEDTLDETHIKIRKLNRSKNLHLEDYATLPLSIQNKIKKKLAVAEVYDDKETKALIHTGIVSIEASIRQYVQKYARTAKIKNIVDTLAQKLEEASCFEETKKELAKNIEYNERIDQAIAKEMVEIRKTFDAVTTAKELKRVCGMLNQKLTALTNYATNKSKVDENIAKAEERLAWLEGIKNRLNTILEI